MFLCSDAACSCMLGCIVGGGVGSMKHREVKPCVVDTWSAFCKGARVIFELSQSKLTPLVNKGLQRIGLPGLPVPRFRYGGARRYLHEVPKNLRYPKTSNRSRLTSYIQQCQSRLLKNRPSQAELTENIEPSVVRSVKRLSAGAPAEVRAQLKKALEDASVLPAYKANLKSFQEALRHCIDIIGTTGGQDDDHPGVADEDDAGGRKRDPIPTKEELKSLNSVVKRLWEIDAPQRLSPGTGFRINKQSRAGALADMNDRCKKPFFEYVDAVALTKDPCTKAFIALLDNYERDPDHADKLSNNDQMEMDEFMKRLMQTPPMRYAHKVLIAWGMADMDPDAFEARVFEIWFTQYSLKKNGPLSSSGFEHVFVGEEKYDRDKKKNVTIGMHNWIQFWQEEKAGRLDYRGYVGKSGGENDQLVSVRFAIDDNDAQEDIKSVSTFLVGTSVAFEFAVATIAFLGFKGDAKIDGIYFGDDGPVRVTTYNWGTRIGEVVRSVFYEA
eukprot:TRINITY_DN30886_c0_g1_i1.p1 TRINITY_DN30886_c0_g1~~TRINITY_DN30886_c0_g1_i1.p1  ORF type:complete len:498 (-),score=113.98 TRINITY_DN30886_c0_g1_i1:67-1560(-)